MVRPVWEGVGEVVNYNISILLRAYYGICGSRSFAQDFRLKKCAEINPVKPDIFLFWMGGLGNLPDRAGSLRQMPLPDLFPVLAPALRPIGSVFFYDSGEEASV